MEKDSKSASTEQPRSVPSLGTGNLGSLADRIKTKTQSEAGAIQSLTQNELVQHQQNLQRLSSDALDSTRDVIASHVNQIRDTLLGTDSQIKQALTDSGQQLHSQTEQITRALDSKKAALETTLTEAQETIQTANKSVKKTFDKTTQEMSRQQHEMRKALEQQTKQMLWMMKLPMLALLAVCLAVCAGTYAWSIYRIEQADQYEAQAYRQLQKTQQQITTLTAHFCQTPAGQATCTPSK